MRAALAIAIAVLVGMAYATETLQSAVVPLAIATLALDSIDGWIARWTNTASARGARFDMEVDAFLILVLSIYAARTVGPWVLAIGLARYLMWAAGLGAGWLRATVPPRIWRKTVAAVQGIALVYAAAQVGPRLARLVVLIVALALLAVSFGTEAWQLRRMHAGPLAPWARRAWGWAATSVAVLLVWFTLVLPDRLSAFTPAAFGRIPVEALVLVVIALVLPHRTARVLGGVAGLVLAVFTALKLLDIAFYETINRPFDAVNDWGYFGPAGYVLSHSVGTHEAMAIEVAAVLLVLALLVLVPIAAMRLTGIAARNRRTSARVVGSLGMVWVVCAAVNLQFGGGGPVASTSATGLAVDQVRQIRASIEDEQVFAGRLAAHDPVSSTPPANLLNALRGKDVVFAFVESYGRVALEGTPYSAETTRSLQNDTAALQLSGFTAKSAFLTSPTFGGISWLAHSSLQSGLWIDNQQRYDQLVASDRSTLSDAFGRAGWRTVLDAPLNTSYWPEGQSFYHYDKQYGQHDVGYRGPAFGYPAIPDQYTLSAFNRLELAKPDRLPVMAEIDLDTSHSPWARIPPLMPWNAIGDGAVYDGLPAMLPSPGQVWETKSGIQAAYAESIRYSMRSLTSFVQNSHDDNLVVVALGDHQPSTLVSGRDATHDVPISIIAKDQRVLDQISSWNWDDGLLPAPDAPVWPMSSFRDRFLTAYGSSAVTIAEH